MKLLILILSVLTGFVINTSAQNIPQQRKFFHDNIDNAQRKILMLDGKDDNLYVATAIPEVNIQLSNIIGRSVDQLQMEVENNSSLDNNSKIKYLRGISEIINSYYNYYRFKKLQAVQLIDLWKAFAEAVKLEMNGSSILPVIETNELEIGQLLIDNYAFQKNAGIKPGKDVIVLKSCERNPYKTMAILTQNPYNVYADSLIKGVAYRDQEELYNYASASNNLAKKISEVDDPLVKLISKLSKMKSGRQYFPFLDNLYRGKQSIEEIDKAADDNVKYYKLLVATQIDYADRLRQGDTPIVMQTLTKKLQQKAIEVFINEINALHEEKDEVRFKILDQLTAQELYYLAVLGETEIYTSSYTRGVYPKIFQKMKFPRADSLLMSVKFDHFKKFIKVAANYNTLDDFLKRMEKENAVVLMTAFVNNLDKTSTLEDAVDVADSYASISDKEVKTLILKQVQQNLEEATSERAKRIYGIMHTIFISKDTSTNAEVFEKLGIPPVYYMPNQLLKDSSGRIIVQQFFYGDKDGLNIFNAFIRQFNAAGWKMTATPQWIVMTSNKGVPVSIYSNRPLDTEQDLDVKAQQALSAYLESKGLYPSVVIHRGHSYYTNSTIKQLPTSAKVVFLGSCGGYHNLHDVLSICPEAHIIATKQTGTGLINLPLINILTDDMRRGKNLNWTQIWSELEKQFKKNENFEDYIPPHKNLGAIFIMAYSKAEENDYATN